MLTVNEIFHSIQGESTYAGRPCVFVRLTACDLRCSWCDTPYAFHEGHKMSLDAVVEAVARYGEKLVEVTGGEPLLQAEVYPLMQRLLDEGYTVLLETGGHRSVALVPAGVVRIIDIKCPGSGEVEKNDWANLEQLRPADQVKFVVVDRADYEFASEVVGRFNLSETCAAVLFSPVHDSLAPKTLAEWMLEDKLAVRMQLQLHKYHLAALDSGRVRIAPVTAPAVALLSGGLDSYTAAAIARADGFEVHALTVRYGQRHDRELDAAREVATALGVARHLELALDLRPIGGSSLTSELGVPRDRDLDDTSIPSTYVPARNTIFLSLALGWAEVLGSHDLYIGVNALDYSGYPDCRPEFIQAYETLAGLATKAGVEGARFHIHTPLINLTKAEIIGRGLALGLDYGLTHSCYDPLPSGAPCGHCDSCVLRARGFAEAGCADPLILRFSGHPGR